MIDFIKENISWLKDFFTLIFVGAGTIVTILTYRRARATILQPIRTEVIKKQAEILSSLLQTVKEDKNAFEYGLDYVELVYLNVILTLRDYGFIFKEHKEIINKIQENKIGWIPCGKSNILKSVEVIGTFKENIKTHEENKVGVERLNNLKLQNIDVEKIYFTEKHSDFVTLIREFKKNPFTPSTIQQTLEELLNDIQSNLTIILKSELEIFMLQFSKEYFEMKTIPSFNPIGVYNSFNHSRVHHKQNIEKLRSEIRRYLRIDEKW